MASAIQGSSVQHIAELRPGDKNVHARLVLVERLGGPSGRPLATKDGHTVTAFKAADESAAVELAVWDRPGEVFAPGDVVVLRGGYASLFRTRLVLYVGMQGTCLRRGRAPTPFRLTPDMSSATLSWEYDEGTKRWQQAEGERPCTDAASVAAHLALSAPRGAPPGAAATARGGRGGGAARSAAASGGGVGASPAAARAAGPSPGRAQAGNAATLGAAAAGAAKRARGGEWPQEQSSSI